jgi:hypothetical protein
MARMNSRNGTKIDKPGQKHVMPANYAFRFPRISSVNVARNEAFDPMDDMTGTNPKAAGMSGMNLNANAVSGRKRAGKL